MVEVEAIHKVKTSRVTLDDHSNPDVLKIRNGSTHIKNLLIQPGKGLRIDGSKGTIHRLGFGE